MVIRDSITKEASINNSFLKIIYYINEFCFVTFTFYGLNLKFYKKSIVVNNHYISNEK